MQLSVIGAGAIGSAIAMNLVGQEDVTSVRICDANARSLQRLASTIDNEKLHSFQVNARDVDALAPVIRGSQCVIAAVGYDQLPELARIAVRSGAHYCDLGGSDENVAAILPQAAPAREAGRWIVPGCGLAPGLVNVLCMLGIEQFDRVAGAFIRIGSLPVHPRAPFDFSLSWSARRILDDYTLPVRLIEDQEVRICEPMTGDESIEFDEPFGQLEAFYTAGGLLRMPDELQGKVGSLNLKTIRWPGHADRIRFLLGLGFGESKSIDVRTHLTYRDLLLRRMKQRLAEPQEDVVLMRIVIQGEVGGQERTLRYEMVEGGDADLGLNAMRRCTSIPATVIACQLASGMAPGGGAATPEFVISRASFLRELRNQGLNIRETWTDGLVSVREAC
jgi:lysine 6-dehydrogenase